MTWLRYSPVFSFITLNMHFPAGNLTLRTQEKQIHKRCSKKENPQTFTQDRTKGRSLF